MAKAPILKNRAMLIVDRIANRPDIEKARPWRQPKLIVARHFLENGHGNRSINGRVLEYAIERALYRGGVPPDTIRRHVQLKPPNGGYGRPKGWEIDLLCTESAVAIGAKMSGRERIALDFGLAFYIFGGGAWQHMPSLFQCKPKFFIVTRQEDHALAEDVELAKRWVRNTEYWLTLGETPAQLVTILDDDAMKRFFFAAGARNGLVLKKSNGTHVKPKSTNHNLR